MTKPPDTVDLCLRGAISPQVAVARLLLGGATARAMADLVEQRRPDPLTPVWSALAHLVHERTAALDGLAAEIARGGGDHTVFSAVDAPDHVAAFFDERVAHSPEASVALFSLGDPAILAAATMEVVEWLGGQGLLDARPDLLDLGCGIGRLAIALAPHCRSVLGLDVSPRMVEEARRRGAGTSHLRFQVSAGRDLATLPPAAFDLVLAVDSFPYIIQAGEEVVARHLEGAARTLRPGGALAILNMSYRQNAEADIADATDWAARYGLRLILAGETPFALWDGTAFVLRRPQM